MLRRVLSMVAWTVSIIGITIFLVLMSPRMITSWYARGRSYSVETVPTRPVAIVFGAGLWRDGSPSPVLRDRVATAAKLYFTGKIEKLLMTGDNRFLDYNEPGAMRTYALALGVPEKAIVLDYAGRRTYDSCYRAQHIFEIQRAVLVTQSFHMPRALYTCNQIGLNAIGVPSDLRDYHPDSRTFWNLREIPATLVALWEVHFTRPVPVLGKPEPIFPRKAQ